MDRGFTNFARWHSLHQTQAFFVIRGKSNLLFHHIYSRPVDKTTGLRCDQTITLVAPKAKQDYPQQLRFTCINHRIALPLPLAGRAVLQVDQTASPYQAILRHIRERGKNTDMDCHLCIRPSSHREEKTQDRNFALHNITNS